MALGSTFRTSPSKATGSWSIQTSDLVLTLSERAEVSVSGGVLLGAAMPARITLRLAPRGRGENLATLRRDLLPFVRPEAGGLTLAYAGAARTVTLPCRYVEGLERLELVLDARAATWRGSVPDTLSGMVEQALPLNTPISITPEGSAGSPPRFWFTFAAGGSLTRIENNVVGMTDVAYWLNFAGAMPGAGWNAQIMCEQVLVLPDALFAALQPGSTFGAFRLVGGIENLITVSGANLLGLTMGYTPRYWSFEDADA